MKSPQSFQVVKSVARTGMGWDLPCCPADADIVNQQDDCTCGKEGETRIVGGNVVQVKKRGYSQSTSSKWRKGGGISERS